MSKPIVVGSVAYDPKIVTIWDIIRDYFNENGVRLDYMLFSNYEAQIEYLLSGKIDLAWNTNVAWVRTYELSNHKAQALLMRDTDIDFKSVFIAKTKKNIKSINDLKGKKFGLGSEDSAQAAILPLKYLENELGKDIKDVEIIRYNSDLGKHGDTGRSEFDVLEDIKNDKLDAGAIGVSTWVRIIEEGLFPDGEIEAFYTSEGYCHCNFTALNSLDENIKKTFIDMMLKQDPNDPIIKKMMQMEGLNKWVITTEKELRAYDVLTEAMKEQDLIKNNW
ncbi:phosphate/phosphite/phosphonate ABC transporter substrate-binding protein [Arcobacter porcinus]|uniref:ABC transporter, phosphonate, periplasmic substrate-binding protein n=1 Tax=Arcobacter porcinus TaxID=1935204 RepID=A0ABX2YAF6_9BACT|nr:PhnD/SsuA/transferrin family substrate-binding protein [Arcobacter porcinus]OCL81937.1 ABC transporter, phosphonate, periplasmic substrate-binding protein [Arcobacter porcinus]OCL90355.1 ABC transporter, phosphonate, periplasmic substrate-binding protein [Arcobacter porcinus]